MCMVRGEEWDPVPAWIIFAVVIFFFSFAVALFAAGTATPQGKEFLILETVTTMAELGGKRVALTLPAGSRVTVWALEEKEGETVACK